jgi:hypothetical protein
LYICVKGVKNILSSKGKMSDDKEDQDAKRQEELRKRREYQRAYEAKNKEDINRKKREKYAKERKVITKAILKDAVAKGLSDAEIAKLVREM